MHTSEHIQRYNSCQRHTHAYVCTQAPTQTHTCTHMHAHTSRALKTLRGRQVIAVAALVSPVETQTQTVHMLMSRSEGSAEAGQTGLYGSLHLPLCVPVAAGIRHVQPGFCPAKASASSENTAAQPGQQPDQLQSLQ